MYKIYSLQINISKWISICDFNCETDQEAIDRVNNLIELGFLQDFRQKYDFRLLSPDNSTIFSI